MFVNNEKSITMQSSNLTTKIKFMKLQNQKLFVVFDKRNGLQKIFNDLLSLIMTELSDLLTPLYDRTPQPK